MDPWNNTKESAEESHCDHFEDNFEPEVGKLPDSEKYLAILEEKLHKIKTDPNVMEQLAKKREDCFNQLLNNTEPVHPDDLSLNEPIEGSVILRTILPQRQALTQGEVAELLKYDHLTKSDANLAEQTKNDT